MAMRRTANHPILHPPGSAASHAPSAPRPRDLAPHLLPAPRHLAHALRATWQGVAAVPRWFYRGYHDVNAGDLAAAIAYHALVALVPSFLLLVSVAGFLLNRDDAVLRTALNAAFWALPSAAAREAFETLLQARDNHGWLGVASVVGFIWVGTGFMSSLARGMNRVYQVPNRHYVHTRIRAFFVVVAFAILFQLATLAAIIPTYVIGKDFVSYFQPWLLRTGNGRILSYGVAATAAMTLFLLLFWSLPNAGQRLKDIWPGTLASAAMFLGIVQIFPLYLRIFSQLNRTATLFGFVSVLVFWFYLLAHVLLVGTFINATWQCHRRRDHVTSDCPTIAHDQREPPTRSTEDAA